MGDSHIRSNLKGKLGTETITGFATMGDSSTALVGATVTSSGAISGTGITGTGALQGATVRATSYITVGTNKYIFFSNSGVEATIISEATALVGTPIKGSLVLAKDNIWVFRSDTSASTVGAVAP